MLFEMQQLEAALAQAMLEALPEGSQGLVLRAVVTEGDVGPRIAHAMEAVCRRRVATPPDVLEALRRRVAWGRENGQAFSSATYAAFHDGDEWRMHGTTQFPDSSTPLREPLREGGTGSVTFSRLVEQHIVEALCKGERFRELAGDSFRCGRAGALETLDVAGLGFPMHAVPIATSVSEEWLWFWANPGVDDPDEARISSRIREVGNSLAIPDFATPRINCAADTAAELAYVAGCMIDADFVHGMRDDRRTLWLHCWAPQLRERALGTSSQLRGALQVLPNVDCNARRAVAWGLSGMRLRHRWDGRRVTMVAADQIQAILEFDDHDRMTSASWRVAAKNADTTGHAGRELILPPDRMTFAESVLPPADKTARAAPPTRKAPRSGRRRFR